MKQDTKRTVAVKSLKLVVITMIKIKAGREETKKSPNLPLEEPLIVYLEDSLGGSIATNRKKH